MQTAASAATTNHNFPTLRIFIRFDIKGRQFAYSARMRGKSGSAAAIAIRRSITAR